jgi:hypothetical protein
MRALTLSLAVTIQLSERATVWKLLVYEKMPTGEPLGSGSPNGDFPSKAQGSRKDDPHYDDKSEAQCARWAGDFLGFYALEEVPGILGRSFAPPAEQS